MQTAKAQSSLRIRAVLSGPSLSVNGIIGYYIIYEWRAKARMKLRACAGWFDRVLRIFKGTLSHVVAKQIILQHASPQVTFLPSCPTHPQHLPYYYPSSPKESSRQFPAPATLHPFPKKPLHSPQISRRFYKKFWQLTASTYTVKFTGPCTQPCIIYSMAGQCRAS